MKLPGCFKWFMLITATLTLALQFWIIHYLNIAEDDESDEQNVSHPHTCHLIALFIVSIIIAKDFYSNCWGIYYSLGSMIEGDFNLWSLWIHLMTWFQMVITMYL